jgi:quercetin dioxygenase-like cupin family protein
VKVAGILAVVTLIVAGTFGLEVARPRLTAPAQQAGRAPAPGTRRTELQRHDLGISGREVVQVRVDFDPGYFARNHTHPGEEVIYVLEGTIEYRIEGQPPETYRAGQALLVPAGAVHSARNVGEANAAELATYIVEKGRPLITLTP